MRVNSNVHMYMSASTYSFQVSFAEYSLFYRALLQKRPIISCQIREIMAHHLDKRGVRMGWLRLLGSFILQVSFAKEPYKRDYILQKRPIIFKSLLIVATPY